MLAVHPVSRKKICCRTSSMQSESGSKGGWGCTGSTHTQHLSWVWGAWCCSWLCMHLAICVMCDASAAQLPQRACVLECKTTDNGEIEAALTFVHVQYVYLLRQTCLWEHSASVCESVVGVVAQPCCRVMPLLVNRHACRHLNSSFLKLAALLLVLLLV